MDDDFGALLGDTPRKRGRPSNAEREARLQAASENAEQQRRNRDALRGRGELQQMEGKFFEPVGPQFLHRVLRMDQQTIRQRLRNVRPLPESLPNRPLWYFHDVLPHLVKPVMSAEEFARTLNKADLPPEINKSFWDAQRSRVKYKIESQEAWETEDVLEVLGDVAMTIKDSLVAVVEEMRNRAKLTDEQTELLSGAIDEIRSEIRQKLIDLPAKKANGSLFAKPMFGVREEPDAEGEWLAEYDEGDEG